MGSKLCLSLFLLISSWVFVGYSGSILDAATDSVSSAAKDIDTAANGAASAAKDAVNGASAVTGDAAKTAKDVAGAATDGAHAVTGAAENSANAVKSGAPLPCVQKLMPCQPFLKNPVSPPAICCAPLKGMIADDPTCLCEIFNNAELLKQFDVTQEEALKLPTACGVTPDLSKCKGASTPAAPAPATPSNGTANNSTSTNSAGGESSNGWLSIFTTKSFRVPLLFDLLIFNFTFFLLY